LIYIFPGATIVPEGLEAVGIEKIEVLLDSWVLETVPAFEEMTLKEMDAPETNFW
jgi:hypothetical protein